MPLRLALSAKRTSAWPASSPLPQGACASLPRAPSPSQRPPLSHRLSRASPNRRSCSSPRVCWRQGMPLASRCALLCHSTSQVGVESMSQCLALASLTLRLLLVAWSAPDSPVARVLACSRRRASLSSASCTMGIAIVALVIATACQPWCQPRLRLAIATSVSSDVRSCVYCMCQWEVGT